MGDVLSAVVEAMVFALAGLIIACVAAVGSAMLVVSAPLALFVHLIGKHGRSKANGSEART